MQYSYLIISPEDKFNDIQNSLESYVDLNCLGKVSTYNQALDFILEFRPQILFFNFSSEVGLHLITDLKSYVDEIPYIVGLNADVSKAYDSFKYELSDFLLLPLNPSEIRRSYYKIKKKIQQKNKTRICVKSAGEYNFIALDDIMYLKADNNTTDFCLLQDKTIVGYKTMKFYEEELPSHFFRIHKSYIVNSRFVSKISIGKLTCSLNEILLPFSRTYREQVESLITILE